MTESFGARLSAAIDRRGAVCAGIDPHASLLQQWGLPDDAHGLEEFSKRCLEGLSGASVIKPQSAFFERHGSAGIAVLEELLGQAREAGILTILDVKRGDIGSTMAGYAHAYLPKGAPLEADAITVSPYMGPAAFDDTAALAAEHGKGLFALALTSNPEGAHLQRSTWQGESVAHQVVAWTRRQNELYANELHGIPFHGNNLAGKDHSVNNLAGKDHPANNLTVGRTHTVSAVGKPPMGSFGVVIGATITDRADVLGDVLEAYSGPILMPGFGAQGGTVSSTDARLHIVVSSSRGILQAGPEPADLAEAWKRTTADVMAALNAGE